MLIASMIFAKSFIDKGFCVSGRSVFDFPEALGEFSAKHDFKKTEVAQLGSRE